MWQTTNMQRNYLRFNSWTELQNTYIKSTNLSQRNFTFQREDRSKSWLFCKSPTYSSTAPELQENTKIVGTTHLCFYLATVNTQINGWVALLLHLSVPSGLLLHYTMRHDTINLSMQKTKEKKNIGGNKRKKNDFKQRLFLVVNFCSQLFVSLSQSYPWKIPVEFFFSPCVSKITAVTRLRRKRRVVGYTVTTVKRLFQQCYRQIQGQILERYFRHLKIKTSVLKHESTELQVLPIAHPESF